MKHLREHTMRLLGAALAIAGLMAPLAVSPAVAQGGELTVEPRVAVAGEKRDFEITGEDFSGDLTLAICAGVEGQPKIDDCPEAVRKPISLKADGTFDMIEELVVPNEGIWIAVVSTVDDQETVRAPRRVQTFTTAASATQGALSDARESAGAAEEARDGAEDAAEKAGEWQEAAGESAGAAEEARDGAEDAAEKAGEWQEAAGESADAAGIARTGAEEAATAARVAQQEAEAVAQAAAAATAAAVAAVVEGEGSSSAGTTILAILLVGVVAIVGLVALLRRQEQVSSQRLAEVRSDLEMAHTALSDEIASSLDKINADLVVSDSGPSLTAEAYERLREKVNRAAKSREAHESQLASIDLALMRNDSIDDLRKWSSSWLRQAGIEKIGTLAGSTDNNSRYFEVRGEGEGDLIVTSPAYVVSQSGHPVQKGQAHYRDAVGQPADDDPEGGK